MRTSATVAARICARLEGFPLSIIQLAMRIAVGAVFFRSGLLKINSWEFAVQLFRDEYRVPLLDPAVAAQLAAAVELGVPLFLFAGFATRLATLPLLGMIAVIQVLVYPNAWTDHLLWASILVFLLTRGPGALSLDHLIARRGVAIPASARHERALAELHTVPSTERGTKNERALLSGERLGS